MFGYDWLTLPLAIAIVIIIMLIIGIAVHILNMPDVPDPAIIAQLSPGDEATIKNITKHCTLYLPNDVILNIKKP